MTAVPSVPTLADLHALVGSFDTRPEPISTDDDALDAMAAGLESSGLLLVGEIHGVAPTPSVVAGLHELLDVRMLALEWPQPLATTVKAFRRTGQLEDHPLLWLGDGRITAGHLAHLHARAELPVLLFDPWEIPEPVSGESAWTARDHAMAGQILDNTDAKVRTLVVAGNAHTPTSRTALGLPMGAWLARERPGIRAVTIRYGEGTFYNHGSRTLNNPEPPGEFRCRLHHDEIVLDHPAPAEAHVPHRAMRRDDSRC